ncbi:MAG: helicase RepA family protein, partial [Actinomycetota bacterium]|nr:helicase RepA family protein [Actinomycetota bacterium]
RKQWADAIRGADVLILDCLRPILDALGLDENHEAGQFFVAFDALLKEAGISEALIVHHMGHAGERSRGDSRILDWPDVTWKLVRENPDDTASTRYLSAFGRDVDVPEGRLDFDPQSRRMTLSGGSRHDRDRDEAVEAVVELLTTETGGLSGRAIEEALVETNLTRKAVRSALKKAERDRLTVVERGLRNSKLHTLNPANQSVRRSAPSVRRRTESECASAYIGALHSLNPEKEVNAPTAHSADSGQPRDFFPPETRSQPPAQCAGCGRPLLLTAPGRDLCARCAPDSAKEATA